MKRLFAILLLVFTTNAWPASFETGNDLLQKMKDCDSYDAGNQTYDNVASCAFTLGYIAGITDMVTILQDAETMPTLACVPSGVTQGQLKSVVRKYLDNNPENLHYNASSLVLGAFIKAFPCKE